MTSLNEKEYAEPFCIIGSKGKFHPSYRFYLPPLVQAMEIPKQEGIKFYKNIDDKTELFLREKLAELQRELQEHFSQVHSDKKKRISKYD